MHAKMTERTEPELVPLPFDPLKQPTCPRCGGVLSPVRGGIICPKGHLFVVERKASEGGVKHGRR